MIRLNIDACLALTLFEKQNKKKEEREGHSKTQLCNFTQPLVRDIRNRKFSYPCPDTCTNNVRHERSLTRPPKTHTVVNCMDRL